MKSAWKCPCLLSTLLAEYICVPVLLWLNTSLQVICRSQKYLKTNFVIKRKRNKVKKVCRQRGCVTCIYLTFLMFQVNIKSYCQKTTWNYLSGLVGAILENWFGQRWPNRYFSFMKLGVWGLTLYEHFHA